MDQNQEMRYKTIKLALRKLEIKTDAGFGRLGEKDAGFKVGKQRIPSLTKTAKYRIPDILSDTYLLEVKNVKYQGVSNQIRDFLAFCRKTSRRLILCIRSDTKLSTEIQKLLADGEITIQNLRYYLSEAGRTRIYEALKPAVLKALMKNISQDDVKPNNALNTDGPNRPAG